MKKILVIGKRGFLGKNIHEYFNKKFKSKIIHFKDINKFKKEINNFNYVINTSINKNYINKRYLKKYDNDFKFHYKQSLRNIFVYQIKKNKHNLISKIKI